MSHLDQLLAVSTAFCEARQLSVSRVSNIVFADGKVLDRIATGSDLTTRRFERAMQWFSDNWPADTAWPDDVLRPDPTPPLIPATQLHTEGVRA